MIDRTGAVLLAVVSLRAIEDIIAGDIDEMSVKRGSDACRPSCSLAVDRLSLVRGPFALIDVRQPGRVNHNVRFDRLESSFDLRLIGYVHGKHRTARNIDGVRMVIAPNFVLAARPPHQTMAQHATASGNDDPHEASQPVLARRER